MLEKNNFFSFLFKLYIILFILLFISLAFIEKGTVVLALNGAHTDILDTFFKYTTNLGDGLAFGILVIVLIFVKYRYAIMVAGAGLLHGLIIALFKNVFFAGSPRPKTFFAGQDVLHFVEGVSVHGHRSFPSGHTASAFAWTLMLILIIKRKSWLTLLLAVALIVGASRIYLAQHFYVDTVVGALIGSVSSAFVYRMIQKWQGKAWFDKSVPWFSK
ncbi:MAG: phosphatase PAP2 family protein [Bacteroidota bacterium]